MENINETRGINPGPWLLYMFAAQMWLTVLTMLEVLQGDYYLLVGAISLISLPFWIKASNMFYKNGDELSGHFYMVFGLLFAGFVGISYVVLYFGHVFPALAADERILGFLFLTGGIYLIPSVPSFLYMDKISFFTWTICAVWLVLAGILYFVPVSAALFTANLVLCIVFTLGITYMMLNEIFLMAYNKPLPMGKPFIG